MSRLTKKVDWLVQLLETACGHLTTNGQDLSPVTRMRIEQAIRRFPELRALLQPALDELNDQDKRADKAERLIRNALDFLQERKQS